MELHLEQQLLVFLVVLEVVIATIMVALVVEVLLVTLVMEELVQVKHHNQLLMVLLDLEVVLEVEALVELPKVVVEEEEV